jgi:hypothetical protein
MDRTIGPLSCTRQSIIAGLLALLIGLSVAVHGLPVVVSQFMVDDSFYYLKIAGNIAAGRGFTFDGLHQTNGFQPLFQLMLVPLFWLRAGAVGTIRAEKVMEAVLFTITAVLLFRLGRAFTASVVGAWLCVFVLFLPGPGFQPLGKGLLAGMESGLDAMLLVLLLLCWVRIQGVGPPPGVFIAYGFLLGGLMLARLDNAFLIAALGLWHAWQLRLRAGPAPGRVLTSGAIALTIFAGYLAWNRIQFDGIIPVSGAVKLWESSQVTHNLLAQGFFSWFRNTLWFVFNPRAIALLPWTGLLGIPFLFLLQARSSRRNAPGVLDPQWRPVLIVLWASSVLKIFYYAVFEQAPSNQVFWYYVQEVIELGICAGIIGAWALQRLGPVRWMPVAKTGLALLFCTGWLGILLAKPVFEWELASLSALPEIERRVEPSARIGSRDAGLLGYFLPNPVIHLGGLVNDQEFLTYLESGRVADYVHKEKILYLVNLCDPSADDRLVQMMGAENVQLVYQAGQHVAAPADWVYKLYRVR